MKKNRFYQIFIKIRKRRTAFISLIVLVVILLLAILGNTILGKDPFETNTALSCAGPSAAHWFGTDNLGRDMLSRVLYGSKISRAIGLVSVLFALIVGTALGTFAGYIGGKVDSLLSLIIEAICAFPTVLLGLLLATVMGSGMINIMLAIGISNVPYFARLVRSMAISIRE